VHTFLEPELLHFEFMFTTLASHKFDFRSK
jgi:hypothetical protein